MTSILIVSPNSEQQELIENLIRDDHPELTIVRRSHLKAAREQFDRQDFQIVITTLKIDLDGSTPSGANENIGLQFAQELAKLKPDTKVIIICPDAPDELLAQVGGMPGCRLLPVDLVTKNIIPFETSA